MHLQFVRRLVGAIGLRFRRRGWRGILGSRLRGRSFLGRRFRGRSFLGRRFRGRGLLGRRRRRRRGSRLGAGVVLLLLLRQALLLGLHGVFLRLLGLFHLLGLH